MRDPTTVRAAPTVSGVLDQGFRLYRDTVLPNLALAVAVVLASQAPNIYRLEHSGRDPLWWLLAIVGGAISVFLWTAMLLRQRAVVRLETLPFDAALLRAARRFPDMLVLALIGLLAVALGVLLLVLPGLLAMVIALLAPSALLAENLTPWVAWQHTWVLVRPQLGLAAAVLALTLAVFLVFFIVFAVLGVLVGQFAGGNALAERGGASYGGYLAQALFAPLLTAMTVVLQEELSRGDQASSSRRSA